MEFKNIYNEKKLKKNNLYLFIIMLKLKLKQLI